MSKAAIFKQAVDICNNLVVTGTVTAPDGFIGNASSATKLETSRTIAGQTFDGQQNVFISSTDLTDTSTLVRNNADQTISGVLTANSFVGSGATLTNIPNGALVNSSISINNQAVSLGANLDLTASQWTTYTSDIYYESGNVAIGSQSSNSTLYHKLFVDGSVHMSGTDFVIWNESRGGTFDNSNIKGRALVHGTNNYGTDKANSFLILNFGDDFEYGTQIGGQNSHVSINGMPEQYYALYIHNTAAPGSSNADVRIEGSLTVDGTIVDGNGNGILDSVSLDYIFNDTSEFTLPTYIPGQEPLTLVSASVWTLNGSNDIYFNSGKIGIGTNTPSEALHVKDGNIYVEGGDFYAGHPTASMTDGVLGQRLILDKGKGYAGPNKIMFQGSDDAMGLGYDQGVMKYLVGGGNSHRFFYNAGANNNGNTGMNLTQNNLTVYGSCTANNSFYGSGSGLTNIPGGQIDGGSIPNGALVNSSISINGSSVSLGGSLTLVSSQWTTTGSDLYYNSGNVAIGSTSPDSTAKLYVNGTLKATNYDGSLEINTIDSATTEHGVLLVDSTSSGSRLPRVEAGLKFKPSDNTLTVGGIVNATSFTGSGAGLTSIPNGALTNNSITINGSSVALGGSLSLVASQWGETGSKLYYNAGNVGIGVTDPSTKLEVNGVVKATSFTGSGAGLTNIPGGQITGGTIANASLTNSSITINGSPVSLGGSTTISTGTNYWTKTGSNVYVISENVGIGTSEPDSGVKLQVNGGLKAGSIASVGDISSGGTVSCDKISVTDSSQLHQIGLVGIKDYSSSTSQFVIGFQSVLNTNDGSYNMFCNEWGNTELNSFGSGDIKFTNDRNLKMIINSSGNVGIGTIPASEKLEVSGNIRLSNGTGGNLLGHTVNHGIYLRHSKFQNTVDTTDICEYGKIRFFTGGALANQKERMCVYNDGVIGIGDITLGGSGTLGGTLVFDKYHGVAGPNKIKIYNATGADTSGFGFGLDTNTVKYLTTQYHKWYYNSTLTSNGDLGMTLDDNNLTVSGSITATTINGTFTGNASTVTNGVYTTGAQTIGGIKTFSSTPNFNNGMNVTGQLYVLDNNLGGDYRGIIIDSNSVSNGPNFVFQQSGNDKWDLYCDTNSNFNLNNKAAPSRAFTILNSNNYIRFGDTTIPTYQLDVGGDATGRIPTLTSNYIDFNNGSTESAHIYYQVGGILSVGDSNDFLVIEKTDANQADPDGGIVFKMVGNTSTTPVTTYPFVIRGDGDVGIGTLTPNEKLEVNGNVLVSGGVNGKIFINTPVQSGNATTDCFPIFTTSTGYQYLTSDGGNLKYNPGNNTLYTGNMNVSGTTYSNIFQVTSDITLKQNITDLENPLQKILNIQGKNYTWKNDASNILQSGLIAQQVEEHIPELIQENNGIKTVNYNGIIPYLVESVKIQQNEINIQQNEIESLKEENTLLKSGLASLLARVEALENA